MRGGGHDPASGWAAGTLLTGAAVSAAGSVGSSLQGFVAAVAVAVGVGDAGDAAVGVVDSAVAVVVAVAAVAVAS